MLRTKPMGPCILGEHSTKWATWLHHSIHLWRKSQMFDRDLQGSFKYCIIFSLRFLWHLRWFCSPHLKTTLWNIHCSLSPHVKRHTHTWICQYRPKPRLSGETHDWVPKSIRSLRVYLPINVSHGLKGTLHSLHCASFPLNEMHKCWTQGE